MKPGVQEEESQMLQVGQCRMRIEPDQEDSVVEARVAPLCHSLPYYWQISHCLCSAAKGLVAVVQVRVHYSRRSHYSLVQVLELTRRVARSFGEADC
jgi:hypothetical protein